MNIVLFGYPDSIIAQYVVEILEHIDKNANVSIVCHSPIYKRESAFCLEKNIKLITPAINNRVYKFIQNIRYIRTFINCLIILFRIRSLGKIDMINIHYVDVLSVLMTFFKRRKTRLFYIYWGSDLFRQKKSILRLIKIFLDKNGEIVFLTQGLFKKFCSEYGLPTQKYHTIDFGISSLSAIRMIKCTSEKYSMEAKLYFNFPVDKFCVAIGYNGIPQQQHDKVISILKTIPTEIKDKLHLIIHTFSYKECHLYCCAIEEMLRDSGFTYSVITDFFDVQKIGMLRTAVDVFINSQTTDALSASLVEYLYAETVVVSGEWLEYPELDVSNVFYLKYSSFADLKDLLCIIVNDYESYFGKIKRNPNIIYSMYSWDAVRPVWLRALRGSIYV